MKFSPGMVVYACKLHTLEAKELYLRFKTSLDHIARACLSNN
jgi:hypothetical protein